MDSKFIKIIDYIGELQDGLDNEELSDEDMLLLIVKNAVLSDPYYSGSIIFTYDNRKYIVSSIQKRSYAWLLQGKEIDVTYVISELLKSGVDCALQHYPISDHMNDYELSFSIPKLKKKTRIK